MTNGKKNSEFKNIVHKFEETPSISVQNDNKDSETEPSYLPEDRSSFIEEVILEAEDNVNEFGGRVDVRYLKNIRSIKEKIRSCISCSENECPIIKQRLDRHLIKHHSSTSNNKQRDSGSGSSSYVSQNSSLTPDGQSSTTDILKDAKNYKKLLRNEILEWAKEIPIYPEHSIEVQKQNLVNKFIDKVNDMFSDIYKENYNLILRKRTASILNSLPGLDEEKILKEELKDYLLNRVNRLNRKFFKISYKNKENKFPEKPEVREVATSTLLDKLLESTKKQHMSTNTVQEYYSEVVGSDTPYHQANVNNNVESLVNAQVQVQSSTTNMVSFEENLQNEQEEFKEIKFVFKQKVFDWMKKIMENPNYKFVNANVDKNFIANILWDQLKHFLIKNSPARSDRLVLKIKILDMIDNLPLSTSVLDPIYRDSIADDLNSRLQSLKDTNKNSTEFLNNKIPQNERENLKKIVKEVLRKTKLDRMEEKCEEIINVLLKCLTFSEKDLVKEELYSSIKNLTNLSAHETFDFVNRVIEAFKDKVNYTSISILNKKNDPSLLVNALSVFKLEQKSTAPTISHKRKAIVSNEELLKLNSSEIVYINSIVEVINMWLDTLPKEFKNTEKKYDNIKYLAREIYDQIRLEEEGEVTKTESEKFKIFIIRKWLNRFDFFENASDSRPFIVCLVNELNDIPKTYLDPPKDSVKVCCGSKPQSFEPEIIMKNLIIKYLEYNYSEENFATRYIFGHLLKSELPNLCCPSRKEVYDSLEQYVSGGTLSFKRLDKELQYIMIISDLLNEVPLNPNFDNKKRIEFINRLAQNIYVIEQNNANSDIADLRVVIRPFIEELPISIITNYNENVNVIINDLINNIVKIRSSKSCCQFANSNQINSAIDSKTLSGFIESFIRDNYKSLTEDEIKLEACSLRLVREINHLIIENPDAFDKNEVYKRLANNSLAGDKAVQRFSIELNYAKEISDWLNNLPLLPLQNPDDAETRTNKIGELVHKMCEYQETKKIDPYHPNVKDHFNEYLEKWLLSFPFDARKEIIVPVVIQQLLNRIEKNDKERHKHKQNITKPNKAENIACNTPGPCCSYGSNIRKTKPDPARAVVETIEKWCFDLPIEGEAQNVTELKQNIATKLYQKLSDINANPNYYNNDSFYIDILAQAIDDVLDKIPFNEKLRKTAKVLKEKLINNIMESKKNINRKIAGDQYKQNLEKTISMSIPGPIFAPKDDPGFEIYKDRLATIFILDNFDYSHNAVKLKYEKIIREKIDQYFKNALKRSAAQLTKEQLYNELYSALFRVPIPNEDTITDDVEEIKTRCEIEIWFEKLPLREATGIDEVQEWDKLLTILAKKLHEIEKFEIASDEKMHKEIVKCLRKLPLMPGKEAFVDQFTSDLQARLKSTFAMRKCVSQVDITKFMDKVQPHSALNYETQTQTPLPRCCKIRQNPTKKPADIIIDIVESWCKNLFIPANTQEEMENVKLFKDNMVIKIIIKISELNTNPEIFNDNNMYDVLLDDELESIFATLPSCCDFMQNKITLKQQLISAINSVKPLIIEENMRYKYKQELKTVVNHVLEHTDALDEQCVAVLNNIRNDIVDNFIIYYYYKDDIDGKQMYKMVINDVVAKYLKTGNQVSDRSSDPLMKSNQLICELSKVLRPDNNVLIDEVEEIRMKNEVMEFLNELPLSLNDEEISIKNQIKSTLARRLSDLEKSGHNSEIERKMKEEVKKCLKKIDESIDNEKIESFIERLRNSEPLRKSHPPQLHHGSYINNGTFVTPPIIDSFQTPLPYQTDDSLHLRKSNPQDLGNNQWISLLPITPHNYNQSLLINDPPLDQINISNYGTSQTDFQDFSQDMRFPYKQHLGTEGMENRFANFENTLQDKNRPFNYADKGNNDLAIQSPNTESFTPIQNSYNENQLSNQNYNTHGFEAGIQIMSTPTKQSNTRDEPLSYQIYGKSQNRSISQQSYKRPNYTASHKPSATYQTPFQEESYQSQNFGGLRQNTLQYDKNRSELSPDKYFPSPQANNYNRSLHQQLELGSGGQFQSDQINHQRQQFNQSIKMDSQMKYSRNQHIPCPRAVLPTPGSSNYSQIPSITIPGSFRPPCLPPSQTCHKKSPICKPCRRSSTGILDTESCLRKIVKRQKHAQNTLENQIVTDDEDCFCTRKKRNAKPVCSAHLKKHCKICYNLNSYFSNVPQCRYPGFYYYYQDEL